MSNYYIQNKNQEIQIRLEDLENMDINKLNDHHYFLIHNNKTIHAEVIECDLKNNLVTLQISHRKYTFQISTELAKTIAQLGFTNKNNQQDQLIKSPMPGIVNKIEVTEGQIIVKGQNLLSLEAMKMENIIKATRDGQVQKIHINEKDKVVKNQVLISLV